MARRRQWQREGRAIPSIALVSIGLAVAVVIAIGLALVQRQREPLAAAPQAVDSCRSTPQFVASVATSSNVALATDGREKGLVLRSTTDTVSPYQHPTWDDAGYLGAIAYDRAGNVYAAPTPRLSLVDNPLAGAATIWRADTGTGAMQPFVTLPGAAGERNPFGVLGLFYACDLDTLYAGSVLGSTPDAEHGGVVAIHLPDGEQSILLRDMDVMGVLVVRQGAGYTLYAGLARSPEIIALPLDEAGHLAGQAIPLIDLLDGGATPQERARKLRLVDGALVVDLVPFNFSLQANATDVPQIRRAVWSWDAAAGQWMLRQRPTNLGT